MFLFLSFHRSTCLSKMSRRLLVSFRVEGVSEMEDLVFGVVCSLFHCSDDWSSNRCSTAAVLIYLLHSTQRKTHHKGHLSYFMSDEIWPDGEFWRCNTFLRQPKHPCLQSTTGPVWSWVHSLCVLHSCYGASTILKVIVRLSCTEATPKKV